ncbi:hypothetical protein SUDANB95_08031 (plasmid) [Actinosynnema sp. ALI-1.44]
MITREEMDQHVDHGRARRWEQPLGGRLPLAAEMDGTWWVMFDGVEAYRPAPEPLATLLTKTRAALSMADQQIGIAEGSAMTADAPTIPQQAVTGTVDPRRRQP